MRNYIKKKKNIKRNKSSELFSAFKNQGLQKYFIINGKSKILPKPDKIKKFKRFSKAKKQDMSFKEKCKLKRKE